MEKLISILIPSYKRTKTLDHLLKTIPQDLDLEILINSDNGPNWSQIESICKKNKNIGLNIKYKNHKNTLGLDANLLSLIREASGHYCILMGDDDFFLTEKLYYVYSVLKNCKKNNIKSILRSYKTTLKNTKKLEMYRYSIKDNIIPMGLDSAAWVFKRSVSLAGSIIHREEAIKNYDPKLIGTLLIHAYLSTKSAIKSDTYLMSEPFAVARDTWRDQDYDFGTSINESRFIPGKKITIERSIAFINAYKEVCNILEKDHNGLGRKISLDLSKYSYPFLHVQRINGFFNFIQYCKEVEKINLISNHKNYYIFKFFLLIFGEKLCSIVIRYIKIIIGVTPKL